MANSELRAGERGQRRKMYRDSLTAVLETLRDGRSSQGRRSDGSVGGWQPIEDWPFFGTLDRQSAVRPKVPSVGWPGCGARDTCSVAIIVPAPGRASTMKVGPHER